MTDGVVVECDDCGEPYNRFVNDECPHCAAQRDRDDDDDEDGGVAPQLIADGGTEMVNEWARDWHDARQRGDAGGEP